MAETALESVYTHFGGDCIVTLRLLTDETEGLDPILNPTELLERVSDDGEAFWFEDIWNAIRRSISQVPFAADGVTCPSKGLTGLVAVCVLSAADRLCLFH